MSNDINGIYNQRQFFNAVGLSYQLVLTKIDELKTQELEASAEEISDKSKKFTAQHPIILMTSAERKVGIDDLKKAIVEIM